MGEILLTIAGSQNLPFAVCLLPIDVSLFTHTFAPFPKNNPNG
jgi:hypothetical protein